MTDNSQDEFILQDNRVSIPIIYVMEKLTAGLFDDVGFIHISNTDFVGDDLTELLSENHALQRKRIKEVFHTKSMPDCFAIILLHLHIYAHKKKSGKTFPIDNWKSWEEFAEEATIDVENAQRTEYLRRDDTDVGEDDKMLACCCGHPIRVLFTTQFLDFYMLVGSDCVRKTNITNKSEMDKKLKIKCIDCNEDKPRITFISFSKSAPPYNTKDLYLRYRDDTVCKRCITKREKQIKIDEDNRIRDEEINRLRLERERANRIRNEEAERLRREEDLRHIWLEDDTPTPTPTPTPVVTIQKLCNECHKPNSNKFPKCYTCHFKNNPKPKQNTCIDCDNPPNNGPRCLPCWKRSNGKKQIFSMRTKTTRMGI
jgi:hypothetical protein